MPKTKLAVLIGNRDFFPKSLVGEARQDLVKLLPEFDVEPVLLPVEGTQIGALQTWQDAEQCGDLLRKHREEITGILIVLPNFGDEKAIADAVRLSDLDVPILV